MRGTNGHIGSFELEAGLAHGSDGAMAVEESRKDIGEENGCEGRTYGRLRARHQPIPIDILSTGDGGADLRLFATEVI